MLEQEVKLSVEGSFAPNFPPGRSEVAGVEELPALDLRATYYDTLDRELDLLLKHRGPEPASAAPGS